MRRAQTISPLGRSPARTPRSQPTAPPPPGSGSGDSRDPERGAIRRFLHSAIFDNVGLKFLSMVLAVTVFLLVNTDKDREISVRVGVKYEYPADKVLVSDPLDEVRVTIKGPWRRLREFDERELGRIRLDLKNAPTGDVPITHDMITNLPPGLAVTSISPRSVRVAFDKVAEKSLEVLPATSGRPQHGYIVSEISAVPATAKVRGGERLLGALHSIRTSEVSLEGRTESFEALAELAPPEGVTVDPTVRIAVHVRIDEELVTRRTPALPVVLRGDIDPARYTVSPAQVEVTLTGALLAVEKARNAVVPTIQLTAADKGSRELPVVLEGLPPGVGVRISPERVKVSPMR